MLISSIPRGRLARRLQADQAKVQQPRFECIPDAFGEERRATIRRLQDIETRPQSDFEKSSAFRLSLIVAAVVVGLSVFAPPPASSAAHVAIRATV